MLTSNALYGLIICRFRIVGDNINWTHGVSEEREDHKAKMMHAFGSLAIVQNVNFDHIPNIAPQTPWRDMGPQDFIPTSCDWISVKDEYSILISRVAGKHIPALPFLVEYDRQIRGLYSEDLSRQNKVVPQSVLIKNEQKYADVVEILDYYESVVSDVYDAAGKDSQDVKIHIGGDQLTRERFSGAKCLRIGGLNDREKFAHLGPITFEYLHMMMKMMEVVFKQLYKDHSSNSPGTMKNEQIRIKRTNIDPDVRKVYDQDSDFFVSFVDAYIVVALLEFFGMEDVHSPPTKHIPPQDATPDAMKRWTKATMNTFVKEIVPQPKLVVTVGQQEVVEEGRVIIVPLADGRRLQLMRRNPPQVGDHVKNYGHRVLEIGLLYKNWLDFIKLPDRDRGLRLLKLMMPVFKANNNLSKYSYEIMRLLVHQLCVLSEREAHKEFYGMFVNTKGRLDSNIAVDDRMECHVAKVKKHVKHMYSNRTDANIAKRSLSFAGMSDVAENYDKVSGVIVRSKKHTTQASYGDELSMIEDLRQIRPFRYTRHRYHEGFERIECSCLESLRVGHYYQWLENKLYKFATEHA